MKKKVAKKFIKENYKNVIKVGYCELWNLLNCEDEKYYCAGTYGWNCDIYQLNHNTVIVTGYRSFGNIIPSTELTKEYEEKAVKCIKSTNKYDDRKELLDKILDEFVEKAINKK